ncbi:MAG: hypothetical protein DRO05_06620 [Thermoproteota archaeon]|nr:MAG: hypothetical protein DRO05_06620 [Candidatus Korarchaeota archaeon]
MSESEKQKLMEEYANILPELVDSFGKCLKVMGHLEKAGFSPSEILQDPEIISTFAEKAPPELLGKFVKVLLRLTALLSQKKEIKDMTGDEKIKIGQALIELARDLRDLMESVRR